MNAFAAFALLSFFALSAWPVRGEVSFADASGGYSGLGLPDGENPGDTAALNLTLTPTGQVTGTIVTATRRRVLRTRFEPDGHFEKLIPSGKIILQDGRRIPLSYRVTAQLDAPNRKMTGRVEAVTAEDTYIGAAFTLSGVPPDPEFGDALAGNRQTSFIDPPDPAAVGGLDIPGDGFTLVNVGKAKTRPARLVGKLPDGANYSTGTPLQGRRYAVLSPLFTADRPIQRGNKTITFYQYRGSTYGYGDLTEPVASLRALLMPLSLRALTESLKERVLTGYPALVAALRWHQEPDLVRNPVHGGFLYSRGLSTDVGVDARFYPRTPREGLVPIGLDPSRRENAIITLRRGNMAAPMEAAITIRGGGVQFERMMGADAGAFGNPYRIRMKMNALVGTFTGSFTHPVTSKRTTFSGAFRAKVGATPGQGRGAFRGSLLPDQLAAGSTLESGSVRIRVN